MMMTTCLLTAMLMLCGWTGTAAADPPKKIEGMPCEVCVSQQAYDTSAEDVSKCRSDVVQIRQQRDQCHGAHEQTKLALRDKDIQVVELQRKNDDLEHDLYKSEDRNDPLAWLAYGACGGLGIAGAADLAVGETTSGYIKLGVGAGMCLAGLAKQAFN